MASLRPLDCSAPIAVAIAAFLVHASTACRTITWWDGSSYPLAANTLGILAPPGSLLLTLLGWAATRVSIVQPVAFQLNLLAALIAAVAVGFVTRLAIRWVTPANTAPGWSEAFAGAFAGLSFAFGLTLWTYAVQFTPYILTVCVTALLLLVALEWWRRAADSDQRGWLFVLFLLYGLDFSVHRTNALTLPAAALWVALRRPTAWRRLPTWGAVAGGLLLGLAVHLLVIPLAARYPAISIGDPSSLARFWSYVSMEAQGGGFLVKLWPRNADVWSVQLVDLLEFLRRDLAPVRGFPVPIVLAILGALAGLRADTRRTLGLLAFLLCASLGAVTYFNLPASYMRSIHRHYLPALVCAAPLVAMGVATALRAVLSAARAMRLPAGIVRLAAVTLAAVLAIAPLGAWRANRSSCDYSRVRFTETFARNLLEPLPRDAILLTQGDNDTFPLWYLQEVEKVRTDIVVVNISLANTGWHVAQLRRRQPELATLLGGDRPAELVELPRSVDSTVVIRVDRSADPELFPGALPESVTMRVAGLRYRQDRVVLDLLRLSRWRRPVYVSCTVFRDQLPWIWSFTALEGIAYRVLPPGAPAAGRVGLLRSRLLDRISYANIADREVRMDPDSQALCRNYLFALLQLAQAELDTGDAQASRDTLRFIDAHLPLDRLGLDPEILEPLRDRVEAALGHAG